MSKSGVYLVSTTKLDQEKHDNYTNPDDVTFKMATEEKSNGTPFRGMGKEELLKHSSKPFWVKLRMICVAIILIGWLALIITVVALIFAYPKCRDKDVRSWWQNDVMYRIYVRSFYDSDGDGNGDIKGIEAKLDYIKDLGVDTISLSPIFKTDTREMDMSITDHKQIDPMYGDIQDLRDLIKTVHEKEMQILLDFIPNHTSDQHSWFQSSSDSSDTTNIYRNYYVWSSETNNWNSVYGNTSWEMEPTRNQYYLHQFAVSQPDLNLRSDMVIKELQNIMEYWLISENIDGFYVRNSGYLIEDYDMRNESMSNKPNVNQDDYDYYNHVYTYGLEANGFILSKFRELTDGYSNTSTKFLMADRKGTPPEKLTYYGHFPGSGVHLSLNPFDEAPCNGMCVKEYVKDWLSEISTNKWPNWVTGTEDDNRFGSRFYSNYTKPYFMLSMLLPGTPIIYYGDELGMKDLTGVWDAWSQKRSMRGLMQWENTTNAGFQNCTSSCSGSPWTDVNSDFSNINAEVQKSSDSSTYSFIKELSSLRTNEAFRYGEYHVAVSTENIFSFVREFDGVTGYLIAINFGNTAESHDYTSYHSTIQSPTSAVLTTGSDVGFAVDDDVETDSLSLGPLQGIVVSWDYKAKEL